MSDKIPLPGYSSLTEFSNAVGLSLPLVCMHMKAGKCLWPRREIGTESHELYRTWVTIKRRCYAETDKNYSSYGGRGVRMCGRWYTSFWNFVEDMGEKPGPQYTIDRINNDGPYSPDNCRWATPTQQSLNQRKRKDNKSGYKGVSFVNGKWRASYRHRHLGCFETSAQACNAYNNARVIDEDSVR